VSPAAFLEKGKLDNMSDAECHVNDCHRSIYAMQTCKRHYQLARRAGKLDELPVGRSAVWHTLTQVDMQAKTAVCSQCGPVKIAGTKRGNIACVLSYKGRARTVKDRPRSIATVRAYKLRTAYGLTAAEYDALLAKQAGRCAICGTQPVKRLAVDHEHATGKVRGLLCSTCNSGLGHFKDSVPALENAIAYLRLHSAAAA
jgi:hypothetical protein